jgi:flagellar FliJ protein
MTRSVETPSFTFRLERVRDLRERAEEHAREQLARELQLRMRGEAMLRAAAESVEQARGLQRSATGGAMTAAELQAAQAYLERTEREREIASLQLDRQDAEVEARRMALQNAAREREVLERLKERRRDEHTRESNRRAGAVLDEMAITMHRREGRAA